MDNMSLQVINIKFVEEVEKYPLLYNYTLAEYSRRDLTEKAWVAVGKAVNLTVSECKDKWKNLRAVFVRHMKSPLSGSGLKKKKPYYLAEAMQFTLPFIKVLTVSTHGNLPEVKQEVVDVYEDEEEDSQSQAPSVSSDPLEEPEHAFYQNQPPQHEQPSQNEELSQNLTLESYQKSCCSCKQKRSITEVDPAFMEYFKSKKAALPSTSNDKSQAKQMFLLSLMPELDEMSDQQIKIFKRKVLQLIDDIQNSTPVTTSSLSLASSISLVSSPAPSPMSQIHPPVQQVIQDPSSPE